MAHGKALHYVGDGSRWIPGVPQADLLPEAEASLPVDTIDYATGEETRWTFDKLVATKDYEWTPVDRVQVPAPASEPPPAPAGAAEAAASTADELREEQATPRKRNA